VHLHIRFHLLYCTSDGPGIRERALGLVFGLRKWPTLGTVRLWVSPSRSMGVSERSTAGTRGGQAVSEIPEVTRLVGAMILESWRPHYRHSQVRVKRAPNNRGWVACNDGPAFATQIAPWLALAGYPGPAGLSRDGGAHPSVSMGDHPCGGNLRLCAGFTLIQVVAAERASGASWLS
jgi:hypothetical protein